MKGKIIEFTSQGNRFQGYLADAASGGPGVIVLQEWWGLVEHIKTVCDRFAAAGFTALAPDLYQGQQTDSPDEAGRMMMALNIEETEQILRSAAEYLLNQPACTSSTVGTVGFCMGGQLSVYAAATNPQQVSACVNFYGIHPKVNPPIENLSAPVLGLFGEKDTNVPLEAVTSLKKSLEAAGKKVDFQIYPEAGHAFFNDSRPSYDPKAAEDAWQRVTGFLREHVR